MNDWITDRKPTAKDVDYYGCVYNAGGLRTHFTQVAAGEPWKPIPKCEPYVKPKRFCASWDYVQEWWIIKRDGQWFECLMRLDKQNDECRAAAERIADVYEKVMP